MQTSQETQNIMDKISPQSLIDTAHGLWKAQALSSAVEVGLFDYLEDENNRPKSIEEIKQGC